MTQEECYCCSCGGDSDLYKLAAWDPACRNHGAHGLQSCKRHGLTAQDCGCGCGYRTEPVKSESDRLPAKPAKSVVPHDWLHTKFCQDADDVCRCWPANGQPAEGRR